VNSTEYAYNASIKMMDYLEDFLGIDYPMPKLGKQNGGMRS